jgi:hypothetical protein
MKTSKKEDTSEIKGKNPLKSIILGGQKGGRELKRKTSDNPIINLSLNIRPNILSASGFFPRNSI